MGRICIEVEAVAGLQQVRRLPMSILNLALQHTEELKPLMLEGGNLSDCSVSVIR